MRKFKHKTTKHIAEEDNLKPGIYNISGLNTHTILPKEWIENSNDWEEIIKNPEYVKCITDISNTSYILNKIYKVEENTDFVIGERSSAAKWNNKFTYGSKFEPSTKEAYDLQELTAKFIVGEWYKVTSGNNNLFHEELGWYIKFTSIKLGNVQCSEYIHNKIFKKTNENFGKYNGYTFTVLETLDEIQQYLPDNHVDKIKPKLDYQILSLNIHDSRISSMIGYGIEYIHSLLNDRLTKIQSIKRLSDGEIFTVGDRVDLGYFDNSIGTIKSIHLSDDTKFHIQYNESQPLQILRPMNLINKVNIEIKKETKTDLITVKLTKEKYDLLMQLLEE